MVKQFRILIVSLLTVMLDVQGQEVSFISPIIEAGVRQHLNIDEKTPISFSQLDTITSLDLSRRDVTDIHDLILLPKLREVDLSDNMVKDLSPLIVLDSLESVDLRYNHLKSINILSFSNAKRLTINVAFNYIEDFILFGMSSNCDFTLEGTGFQLLDTVSFFDVSQLFCDASAKPVVVKGLVRTNSEEPTRLICESEDIQVPIDDFFSQTLVFERTSTVPVFLTDGISSDSTYLVPQKEIVLQPNDTVIIETGLPDDYTIFLTSSPEQGIMSLKGNSMEYIASATFQKEEVVYSYYHGTTLKGFSKIVFSSKLPNKVDEIDDGQNDDNNATYDLSGRRVQTSNKKNGIYIKHGKKILIQ